MTTSLDLCKRALAEIGTRTTISALNDGSPEANYCTLLYEPLRDFLLREGDYDFAMKDALLTVVSPGSLPWAHGYTYPDDCLRIRQLISGTYVALDPQPVEWNVVNVGGVRQIYTKVAASIILYTFAPAETVFDPIFQESLVRLLSSGLAFALENRIEASDKTLREAISFAGIANLRDS